MSKGGTVTWSKGFAHLKCYKKGTMWTYLILTLQGFNDRNLTSLLINIFSEVSFN